MGLTRKFSFPSICKVKLPAVLAPKTFFPSFYSLYYCMTRLEWFFGFKPQTLHILTSGALYWWTNYLAQEKIGKNEPSKFYCSFQLVLVPLSTTPSIRLSFLSSKNTISLKGPRFKLILKFLNKKGGLFKK